jgi:hypothetical protein
MAKNRGTITDFPKGDGAATSCLIADHECLVAHLHRLSIYPSQIPVMERGKLHNK